MQTVDPPDRRASLAPMLTHNVTSSTLTFLITVPFFQALPAQIVPINPSQTATLNAAITVAQNTINGMPGGKKAKAQQGLNNFKDAMKGKPLPKPYHGPPSPKVFVDPDPKNAGMGTDPEECKPKLKWTAAKYCKKERIVIGVNVFVGYGKNRLASIIVHEGLRAEQEQVLPPPSGGPMTGAEEKNYLKNSRSVFTTNIDVAKEIKEDLTKGTREYKLQCAFIKKLEKALDDINKRLKQLGC